MENYFVITIFEGEQSMSVKTEKELAELWQSDNDAGYLDGIIAYRLEKDNSLTQVNVYELATEYLRQEREIQQEYEDYCETVREYGYDYYEDWDNLEMGFDPYAGCYSDDC